MENQPNSNPLRKLYLLLLAIGPGIFAIGYTIGTGSVTSMIVAGSEHGMQLLWGLFLSCLFSWVLMEAYGRYALVTGESALFGFKKHLKFGSAISILIIIGVSFGQWNSLIGILGISANAIFETIVLFIPALEGYEYWGVLITALIIISIMYTMLWHGSYTVFERILVIFVSFMGLSFFLSFFIAIPDASAILNGMIPSIPEVENGEKGEGQLLVAAIVGTTMAAATFLSRPLFIQGKGWTIENMKDQSKDARWAAILIFIISGSIMAVAMGAFYHDGVKVERVLDMVDALEPIAGRFAIAIFFIGTLSAGLSSVFPILMICPLLIADYQDGKLDMKSKQFKTLTGIACLISLIVPVMGANPIKAQLVTQVLNVFVLPLVIFGILVLINRKELMGKYKAGPVLNIGIVLSLIFACFISYNGVLAILEKL